MPAVEDGGQITGTVSGIEAGGSACVYALPVAVPTVPPEAPDSSAASTLEPITPPPAEGPCVATPGVVQSQPVVDGSYTFEALAPGSYRLYLDDPQPDESAVTGAPQWLPGKVLKTSAETLTVEAGNTVVAPGATVFPVRSFADVPRDLQFSREISWLASTGISTGWNEKNGSSTFRPVTPIARDAMAVFIYRLAGSPEYTPPIVSPFTDVPTKSKYYKEISWLSAERISTGWAQADKTRIFRPLSPVARDAMAVFLYRFADRADLKKLPASPFDDVATDNVYFKEISWLASTGISGGWSHGNGTRSFRPYTAVNRDAMAAFMSRYAVMINTQP
ncbi:S-layer homology domain-containing protein [Arthrobacter sp. H20]|uniref:S-layer homology domain-containing protein n=1 Tax=Arthrobacter sp. H20 TaxID=1267981 RepID=UPI00138AF72E|nr:S-layer homology domain-containing protein [Arthrobacter sp. H20]